MKILKFGGKSLENGKGLQSVLNIISNKVRQKDSFMVVVSARGNATDTLEQILELAKEKKRYQSVFEEFKNHQLLPRKQQDFDKEFTLLEKVFEGVYLLGDYSLKIKDLVLAQGEILSAKMIAALLEDRKIKAQYVNSKKLLKTDDTFTEANILDDSSLQCVKKFYKKCDRDTIQILTGFIGSNLQGEITTLGRNGSNYSAALFANYLQAQELENYTHVSGIFTANPDLVESARKIKTLSFQEANELANFGTYVLNAKAMIPLIEKNIPLRILDTFSPESQGTLISKNQGTKEGIKAVSVLENMALVILEGKGLLGKVGIAARIFGALSKEQISASVISQGSSERAVSFTVKSSDAQKARRALVEEFHMDFLNKNVNKVEIRDDIVVVSVLGKTLASFKNAYNALIGNSINPILINNTANGNNISLVLRKKDLKKSVNVIHGEIFGATKKINIAVFGVGLVGGTLLGQILKIKADILKRKEIQINVFAAANSKKVLLNLDGINKNWSEDLVQKGKSYHVKDIIDFASKHHLENLIAVDNTASEDFINHYIPLVQNDFNLVSSNKKANTSDFHFYKKLREQLKKHKKKYLYETNVGAGLPLIDTIRLLHHSGENITRIKGVFSGTLSYLFNNFSMSNTTFSKVLSDAISKGYTEPDPREDLNGNDVGRKLLILARELDLKNEFDEVTIENLIPESLRQGDTKSFLDNLEKLDKMYRDKKEAQSRNCVLRYIGDLKLKDIQADKGILEVKLVSVPFDSALGQVKGADSIFEIYTESYGEQPLVIQGAGAGAAVTARGVFGDILRLVE